MLVDHGGERDDEESEENAGGRELHGGEASSRSLLCRALGVEEVHGVEAVLGVLLALPVRVHGVVAVTVYCCSVAKFRTEGRRGTDEETRSGGGERKKEEP